MAINMKPAKLSVQHMEKRASSVRKKTTSVWTTDTASAELSKETEKIQQEIASS